MNEKRFFTLFILIFAALALTAGGKKDKFDYSLVFVAEEGGVRFEKITEDADLVCDYNGELVQKTSSKKNAMLRWWVIPQIGVSPDGKLIGYITNKNNAWNIMVKSSSSGGVSTQRTYRSLVKGFSWSPDGKTLVFTELRNSRNGVYTVDASQGNVVRQISSGEANDYGGVMAHDGHTIFFHRTEPGTNNFSLWSYDLTTNLYSNYSYGMTACPIPGDSSTIYCSRLTKNSEGEIWRVNYATGVEEIILSRPGQSFSTPQLSPDGKWLLVTGSSVSGKEGIQNTDIFVIRTDGTQLTQLTYHPGNDISAVWAPDGRSVFFLSQRGSAQKKYNVWRMEINL